MRHRLVERGVELVHRGFRFVAHVGEAERRAFDFSVAAVNQETRIFHELLQLRHVHRAAAGTRAYAWTGETVWNQGTKTLPEIEIGLKTFDYGEELATRFDAETNFEKVPQLAARWSLDPAEVKLNSTRQATGIAGESAFI